MLFNINKFCLLIILILLQSCSGGKIGNFLESSFKNIEEVKIKEDKKNNLKNKTIADPEKKSKDVKNIEQVKIKEDIKNVEEVKIKEDNKNNLKNKIVSISEVRSKDSKKVTKKNITLQKKQYNPQSYKIIFILKDVDPKDPIEDLSIILRNSDVNFEIEKIERFFDPKNKSIKRN